MNYIVRTLIAIDQLANVVLCNGEPDETMSAAAYRMNRDKRFWGFLMHVIDFIFRPFEKHHCYYAYRAEVIKAQLAPAYKNAIDEGMKL